MIYATFARTYQTNENFIIMINVHKISLIIASIVMAYACGGNGNNKSSNNLTDSTQVDSIDFSTEVTLEYAKQMVIFNKPTHKELYLLDPDKHDTIARYALYPRGKQKPNDLPANCNAIAVPIRSIACSSTTQVGALSALGMEDKLIASSSINNISSKHIQERIKEGLVKEIAKGSSRNNELLLSLHPDVFLMDFSDQREQDEELRRAGVEPILFNSWKETSLLGRAEWLKVTGLLLGENRRADSIFRHIAKEYKATKELVDNQSDTIQILYGADYKGMWYVPGEYSYVTRMLKDAKVKYDYMPQTVNSTPVSFEYVFSRHRHDKIWLSVMVGKSSSLKSFLALNERYSAFDAATKGQIWLDRKRVNQYGGNDYWESGPYNPHLILKDIIKITRPELLPQYETTYFVLLK